MFHVRRLMTVMTVALLGLYGVSCTDDPGQANNANNGRATDPVDAPENGQLLHVDPCTPGQASCVVELTYNNAREVAVELHDPQGQPVENALISFTPDFEGTELSINAASAYTDDRGIAKITLDAGSISGSGELVAKADTESIDPVSWIVSVSSKDKSSYIVVPEHRGTAEIKELEVFLYSPDITCADLAANPVQTAQQIKRGRVQSNGDIYPVPFPDIATGESYTAVVKAKGLNNSNLELAYGCEDDNPSIQNGQPVEVVVPLIDHLPEITGEYKVTHEFDLTNTLPDNVRNIVELIGRLTTDPGSFVVGCPSDSSDPECPAGTPGLAQLLVDFLPDGELKDAIESVLDSGFANSVARDAINAIADAWLENDAPDWLNTGVNVTADIYTSVRNFRVEGVIRISERPDITVDPDTGEVVGVLPENSGLQRWNNFIFTWSGGCHNAVDPGECARRSFGSRQLDMSAVEGQFDGTVFGTNELQINQHTLSLNYGALLVAIVEKMVLPNIFGPGVDSLEAALKEMVSCEAVANYANSDSSSSTYQIVYNLCDNMLDQAGAQLRDYASENLVANGDEVFRIGTGTNCTIRQPDDYLAEWSTKPYPYIQYLGEDSPKEMRCEWDVSIKFSDNYTAEIKTEGDERPATFWGERSSN